MPAKAQWLLRVPEILEELRALDVPVVDRAVCEGLFRLRRRRAIDLLRCFGGYQAGRTFLIDRPKLVAQLEQIRDSADFKMEWQRKERLARAAGGHAAAAGRGARGDPGRAGSDEPAMAGPADGGGPELRGSCISGFSLPKSC